MSLGKIHCREMKAPNWLRISPFIEILIRLLIHHLNSQYLCLVKRSFDTKISFITEDSSSELSWNQILTLTLTLPISGIQPQFLPLFLLLIPTAVIPRLHFKSGEWAKFPFSLSLSPCPFQCCWLSGAAEDSCRDALLPARHSSSPRARVKPSDSTSCCSEMEIIPRLSSGSSPHRQQVGKAPPVLPPWFCAIKLNYRLNQSSVLLLGCSNQGKSD